MSRIILTVFLALGIFSAGSGPPLLHTASAAETGTIGVQWGLDAIHASSAWAVTRGAGAVVCDADSGVDVTHPDLAGAVLGGANRITGDTSRIWADGDGHGTATASVMVGRGTYVLGVAPAAKLLAAKVLTDQGIGDTYSLIRGMQWCVRHGAQVINLSLGGPVSHYDDLPAAVQSACRHNVAIAAAAGNDGKAGRTTEPAEIRSPCLISVSAIWQNGELAPFSNRGENPREVAAPGNGILCDLPGGKVGEGTGTSFAAPLVAGTLALLRSQGVSAVDAVNIVLATARKEPDTGNFHHGVSATYGYGLLDAGRAVHLAAERGH